MKYFLSAIAIWICVFCVLCLAPRSVLADTVLVRLDDNTIVESGSITSTYIIQACREANNSNAEYIIFDFDCEANKLNLIDRAAKEILACKATTVAFINGKCNGAPLFLALHCKLIFFKTSASISPFSPAEIPNADTEFLSEKEKFLFSAVNSSSHNAKNLNLSMFFSSERTYFKLIFAKDAEMLLAEEGIRFYSETGKPGISCIVNSEIKEKLISAMAGKLLSSPEKIERTFPVTFLKNKVDLTLLGLDSEFVMDTNNLVANLEKSGKSPGKLVLYEIGVFQRLADFLNHPVMLCLLLTFAFLALLLEVKTPGTFIGAILAILFFSLFFMSNYICGTAGFLEVSLFLLGMLFLIVEIAVIPGFGFVGAIGIAVLLYSLFAAIIPGYFPGVGISPFDSYYYGLSRAGQSLLTLISAFLLMGLGGMILSKFLPGIPLLKKLVHSGIQGKSKFQTLPEKSTELVGRIGVSLTDLRPTGKVEINGKRIEARSSGAFIAKGKKIRVIDSDFGVQVEEV